MLDTLAPSATRFHISLNVSDLGRAIAFYRVLFGIEPAKVHDDYAKFDVLNPPVVFSLAPCAPAAGWSISHLGLRVADAGVIREIQNRLVTNGIETQCEEGVVCGYAKQSKCWVRDPDHNFWEIYVIEEDVEPHVPTVTIEPQAVGSSRTRESSVRSLTTSATATPLVWEHRVTQDLPPRIPYADESLEEVRLEGTFNGLFDGEQRMHLLRDARRTLKPGGRVSLHALATNKPLPGSFPTLPGIAAFVKRLPLESELPAALREAGFHEISFDTFAESPAFVHDGVELRELKVSGRKLSSTASSSGGCCADAVLDRHVLYKGPFTQVADEFGHVFPRGRRFAVCADTYHSLRQGPLADEFLFLDLDPQSTAGATCGLNPVD